MITASMSLTWIVGPHKFRSKRNYDNQAIHVPQNKQSKRLENFKSIHGIDAKLTLIAITGKRRWPTSWPLSMNMFQQIKPRVPCVCISPQRLGTFNKSNQGLASFDGNERDHNNESMTSFSFILQWLNHFQGLQSRQFS